MELWFAIRTGIECRRRRAVGKLNLPCGESPVQYNLKHRNKAASPAHFAASCTE